MLFATQGHKEQTRQPCTAVSMRTAMRSIIHWMRRDLSTAPIAAAGLIAGYAVAAASGSRPLGGAVLAAFGLTCVWVWLGRDGVRMTVILTGVGLLAFALSHVIALLTGPWPAVLLAAAAAGGASWRLSDSRRRTDASRTRPQAHTTS
jgi:hypothetical protein